MKQVRWTNRSLSNARDIRLYLKSHFSDKEVALFESLLKSFELNVSNFPKLYPESQQMPQLRRAVLHKNLSVFYSLHGDKITVVAMQDNRQERPST